MVAVVEEVEARQVAAADGPDEFAGRDRQPGLGRPARSGVAALRAAVLRVLRQGGQGRGAVRRFLPGAVDAWFAGAASARPGTGPPRARRHPGLLLDLVATDDRTGVDAAAEAFVDLVRRAGA